MGHFRKLEWNRGGGFRQSKRLAGLLTGLLVLAGVRPGYGWLGDVRSRQISVYGEALWEFGGALSAESREGGDWLHAAGRLEEVPGENLSGAGWGLGLAYQHRLSAGWSLVARGNLRRSTQLSVIGDFGGDPTGARFSWQWQTTSFLPGLARQLAAGEGWRWWFGLATGPVWLELDRREGIQVGGRRYNRSVTGRDLGIGGRLSTTLDFPVNRRNSWYLALAAGFSRFGDIRGNNGLGEEGRWYQVTKEPTAAGGESFRVWQFIPDSGAPPEDSLGDIRQAVLFLPVLNLELGWSRKW